MFTGIIETTGTLMNTVQHGANKTFTVRCALAHELKADQSVSHDGVCLTVEAVAGDQYTVTAIEETLKKTNLGFWKSGDVVNIERCMLMNGRLDGHIVQGHVDTTAECIEVKTLEGSWEYTLRYPKQFAPLLIEKGSVALNGTSLTCFNLIDNTFTVAIIPYTYEHTSIGKVVVGSFVNIEFDVIGKYIQRMQSLQ